MAFKLKIVDDKNLPTVIEVTTPDGTEQLIDVTTWEVDDHGRLHVWDNSLHTQRASYAFGRWGSVRRVSDVHLLYAALREHQADAADERAAAECAVS